MCVSRICEHTNINVSMCLHDRIYCVCVGKTYEFHGRLVHMLTYRHCFSASIDVHIAGAHSSHRLLIRNGCVPSSSGVLPASCSCSRLCQWTCMWDRWRNPILQTRSQKMFFHMLRFVQASVWMVCCTHGKNVCSCAFYASKKSILEMHVCRIYLQPMGSESPCSPELCPDFLFPS